MTMNDDPDTFIPPAPVRPGFDRVEQFTTATERWGFISRPSRMKQLLPDGWRPARALTPEEEKRLVDMTLWARAHGVEMADWTAFWEGSWLRKQQRQLAPAPGSKGAMADALRKLDEFIARSNADGPRDGGEIGPPTTRRLLKPDRA